MSQINLHSLLDHIIQEEDRAVLDKQMKRLSYLGFIKVGFSAQQWPVMLIGRKVIKDKRTVPDFRYLNVKNSQKQSCISFTKRYIFNVRKF